MEKEQPSFPIFLPYWKTYFETNIASISLLLEAVITCLSFTKLDSIFKFHRNGTFSRVSMSPFSVENKNSSDASVVCSDYKMKSHFYSVPKLSPLVFSILLNNIQRSFQDLKMQSKKLKKIYSKCKHFLSRSAVLWHLHFCGWHYHYVLTAFLISCGIPVLLCSFWKLFKKTTRARFI